jgi:hypothetical protein
MYRSVSESILEIVSFLDPEGEVVKKFNPTPKIKPKRRRPSFKNKSNRSDYFQQYMKEYRENGNDYQKIPDKIKEYRRNQKKDLEERFKKEE